MPAILYPQKESGGMSSMEWLEQATQLTVILTFLSGLFAYVVLRPLNDTLRELRVVIDKLSAIQLSKNERLNKLEGAVDRIEKAVVTAHAYIINIYNKKEATLCERLGHRQNYWHRAYCSPAFLFFGDYTHRHY